MADDARATSDDARPDRPPASTEAGLRRTSTDRVYGELRRKVIDSDLAPGSQILEQDLATMLGVSRTPVREALIRLENEGLVEIIPRHGVRIVPVSLTDMREIYEVCVSLESTAAGLAAAAALPPDAIDELTAICELMTTSLDGGDIERWALEDEAFHLKVVEFSGNRRLREIVSNCWDQVHRARLFTLRLQPHPQPAKSIQEHHDIIAAIREGASERASELMREHRRRGGAVQMDIIRNYKFNNL
ncbi:GntR family transcriptional regulator [Enterovirga rhinocerotis]|uniref:DNA-binding GntR family transcriptional regulator n=1 Tax=Enterovirga rhinocerotis TaxID=1339210 RepID=A0A4R7BV61_9HYPH|nr:GntR family transcriptional regulator [Enterovirga rhinocerotis]TDR88087.1 DNA-binding GntR family transcriptional regulator [Enterovirga rhinocerotis]